MNKESMDMLVEAAMSITEGKKISKNVFEVPINIKSVDSLLKKYGAEKISTPPGPGKEYTLLLSPREVDNSLKTGESIWATIDPYAEEMTNKIVLLVSNDPYALSKVRYDQAMEI